MSDIQPEDLQSELERLRTELGAWNRQYPLQVYNSELDCIEQLDSGADVKLAQTLAEAQALDLTYKSAAEFDDHNSVDLPEEWEDENQLLRKAALDHRGCP